MATKKRGILPISICSPAGWMSSGDAIVIVTKQSMNFIIINKNYIYSDQMTESNNDGLDMKNTFKKKKRKKPHTQLYL